MKTSHALLGNIFDLLGSPSCDPNEVLHLDQTDLEQPTPEATINDSNQVDVVKLLSNITPAGTAGEFACSIRLSVDSLIHCDTKTNIPGVQLLKEWTAQPIG